ncbi:hypothetical protein HN385_00790 [archaeon]|jgi:hypothetical protein|nr:hypothetical protein [archaeon]MBT3451390.1 hypothetical protein [archaeon]MBT6869561.1 hypothetical protein [archaeon]MBT7193447.1 hypothetical protein [archaeon]MBT7381038.1 hypothetical protein [archaeon]
MTDNLEELFENSRADQPTLTPRINKEESERELYQGFQDYGLLIKLMDYVNEKIPRDQLLVQMQTAYELNLKEIFPKVNKDYFSETGFLGQYLRKNEEVNISQMKGDIGTILSSMAIFDNLLY